MAHKLLREDTPRGEVAAFLAAVESAYPTPSRSPAEDAHLEAIFREARLVRQGALARPPATGLGARARRLLSGAVITCTVGAGAAVGVATAAGGGPFGHLLNPPPPPPSVEAVPSVAVSASRPPTPHVAGENNAGGRARPGAAPATKPGRPETLPPQAGGLQPGAAGRQRAAEGGKPGQERAAAAKKAGQEKAEAAKQDAQDKPGPAEQKPSPQPRTPGKSEAARSRGGDPGGQGKGPKIEVPGESRSQDARAKGR